MIEKSNVLWIALALTLVASIWTSKQESPVDDMVVMQPKVKRHALAINTTSSVTDSLVNKPITMQRREINDSPQNIFSSFVDESVLVAESAAPQPEPPPVNPFIYAGKIVDEGNVMVFLTDMKNDFNKFNRIYTETFANIGATRTTVQVGALPTPIAVEFKVIASV